MKNAEEELFICSPYMSSKYAKILRDKSKQGIDVRIVTSSEESDYHQEALNILFEREGKPTKYRNIALFLALLATASIALGFLWIYTVIAAIPLGLGVYESWEKHRKNIEEWEKEKETWGTLSIKQDDNVHAKFYSADGKKAVIGSPNLTFSGLTKNTEFAAEIQNEKAKEITEYFKKELEY